MLIFVLCVYYYKLAKAPFDAISLLYIYSILLYSRKEFVQFN